MGQPHDDYAWGLHSTEQPVAKLLGAEGYETWMVGLPHETRDAQVLGFDSVKETGDPLLEGPIASPFYYRSGQGLVQAKA
jgi:arylsulfatase A-like enzyme